MSDYLKSKLIHYFHLAGVITFISTLFFFTTFVEKVLGAAILLNMFHPGWPCVLTYYENKYRIKAGLPEMKWVKHYLKSGKPFRDD